ncbi:hypothetical protein GQ457_08G019100 [Hibiscus cannabinus]
MLYVCFSGLKEGFIRYCKLVLCLDSCYLNGLLKGEILADVGRDNNNQIFSIAWAIAEIENWETWGLLEEISLLLPCVEHRFCARHMYAHWRRDHKGLDMQQLLWARYKATNEAKFRKHTARINTLKEVAHEDLMEKDPKYWSRAFFRTHSKCDSMDNNFSQACNSSILPTRYKSIISLFEDIRHYFMNRSLAKNLGVRVGSQYVVLKL